MGAFDYLLTLLASQREVLLRLQTLCRQERECLLNGQLDRLEEIVTEQQNLLTKQAALSTRITSTLGRVGQDYQLGDDTSLSHVADQLFTGGEGRNRAQLSPGVEVDVGRAPARGTREFGYLAQQALKYVDFTLKLISKSKDGPTPYLPPAHTAQRRSLQLLMDNRA